MSFVVCVVLIGTSLVALFKARYKPLWYDELLSLSVAKLPHASSIWSFAETGADGQPPLYYCLLQASIRVFGNDPWGIRVPSTLGYLVFCASLYWFVSRQTSRLYGLVAMLLPGITGCWYYATEGRPYALILACTGIAALSWQSIAMNRGRKHGLAGLGLSLLCAFSFHYFSALLVVPFAIAELARSMNRRKLDPAVWFSYAVPFLLFIPYLPVMRGARANAGTGAASFARPAWYGSLLTFASQFIGPALIALVTLACLYVIFQRSVYARRLQSDHQRTTIGTELSAPITLILLLTCILPVLGVAFGKFVTHWFSPRYVIGSMFGIVALITLIMWLAFLRRNEMALIIGLLLSGMFSFKAASNIQFARGERSNPLQVRIRSYIPTTVRGDQLPIVAANAFLELCYYSDPALSRRIYYVTSEESAMHFEGHTTVERAMMLSAPYFGTRVVDYRAFVKSYPSFYIIGGPRWIVPRLIADGAHLQLIKGGAGDSPTDEIDYFFRVTLPGK